MRILILSLYYKPLNSIASSRIISFKKYFEEHGHHVDILTRYYTSEDNKNSNLEIGLSETKDIPNGYLRKDDVLYTEFKRISSKKKISENLPLGIKGIYNLLNLDIYYYNFVENGFKAYQQEFKNVKHDFIIASTAPPAVLSLANKIYNTYRIPWIADFRDSYFKNNENGLKLYLKKKTLNNILKSCKGIVFVSEGMKSNDSKYLKRYNKNKPMEIIYNGFEFPNDQLIDKKVVEDFKKLKMESDIILLYTGSLYKEGNLDFYLNALKQINDSNIKLVCVGVQRCFKEQICKDYPNLNITFINKVSYATSIKLQTLADFLLLTIWKNNFTGFQGKIFEYLYSQNKIILDKQPPYDLKEYLKEFENVYYCNEKVERFIQIIKSRKDLVKLTDCQKEILTRKYQVNRFNNFISELF